MLLVESAQAVKVTPKDQAKYAKALKDYVHLRVAAEDFGSEEVVMAFRLEAGSDNPRHAIFKVLLTRWNQLNSAQVAEYLAETPKGKRGKKAA
jgi:hypothetical protein